jgi:glycosyltransferase involved in cell wall biosynthesis
VGRTPAILTVHDLSFLRVPEHFVPGFRDYLEGAVSRGVAKACHILADSNSTKRDLIELMGVSPEKVTVVYPGVEARFTRVRDADILARAIKRYDLPERFILGLGTLQPRKNFDGLIHAFRQLLGDAPDREKLTDLHLVICGGSGWMYEDTMEMVQRYGLDSRVRFPGFVKDEDLPALYSLATVFAFPSWYEGFGLPVLEAQACGTPVVAADNSSLPEVLGEGGLMVNTGDKEQLAHALWQALTDRNLRVALASAGRVHAARFTWARAAADLFSIYKRFGLHTTDRSA